MFRKFSPMRAERITAVLSCLTPPPLLALALLAAGATFLMYHPSAHAVRLVDVTRPANTTVAEGGTYAINFDLKCLSDTTSSGTISVEKQSGDDEPGDWEFVGRSSSVVLDCGGLTSASITIHTLQDNDAENETVTLRMRDSGDIRIRGGLTFTLTIQDDDTRARLSVLPLGITEGNTATVTATLDSAVQSATTVTVRTAALTAEPGDFTQTGTTITIPANQTSSTDTVTVRANEDLDADDEIVAVSGSIPQSGDTIVANPPSVGLYINDNDRPQVSLSVSPDSVSEGGTATVTARVTGGQAEETFVTVSASPAGTTVEGDFTLSGQKTLHIPAGENQPSDSDPRFGAVTITANQDGDTNDETVTISGTTSGGVTSPALPVTLNITDDDKVSFLLSASPNPVPEGGTSTVTGTLTGNTQSDTTVTVTAAAGTAEPGDFSQTGASTFTIPAGTDERTGTVTISTVKDSDSDDETVTISAVTNNSEVPTPDSITLTISDLDKVILSANPNPVTEGGTATVTARIPGNEPAPTTVTVSAVAGTAEPDDFSLSANRTLTIAAGANQHSTGEVTITTSQDADADDETVTISATATGAITATPEDVTLTIRDDDAPSSPGGSGGSGSGGGSGGGCAVTGSGGGASGVLPAAAALFLAVSFRRRLLGKR